jgi:hypothetical protein
VRGLTEHQGNYSNVTAVVFAALPAHETDMWLVDVPYGAVYPNRTLVLTVVRNTPSYLLPVVFGGTQGTDVLDVQYPRVCRSTTRMVRRGPSRLRGRWARGLTPMTGCNCMSAPGVQFPSKPSIYCFYHVNP